MQAFDHAILPKRTSTDLAKRLAEGDEGMRHRKKQIRGRVEARIKIRKKMR